MKPFIAALAVITAVLAFSGAAGAVVIDFDDVGDGVEITNQYAGAVFSSQAGSRILTTAQSLGSSTPNFICSATTSINCVDDVYVDFTTPVSGLTFVAVGDNNVGDVGDVRVFGGATLLGTVDIITDSNFFTPHLLDLTAFLGITRIEIANISDGGGLGFDDFTFNGGGAPIPEPAAWAMLCTGLGVVGYAAGRRGRRAVIA